MYRVAANIIEYYIVSKLILLRTIISKVMTTFLRSMFQKSDHQMKIEKYRAAANISEYHNSKIIFRRIIIPKFMMIRQLFHVENVCKDVKNHYI